MGLWHNVINPTARWINLAFFWNKKICKIEAIHHAKFQFFEFFWQKNENLIDFWAFLIILGKYFCILSVFWSFWWNFDQFFGIFDQKNENLIDFLAFLIILMKYFGILACFWPFNWIFNQFFDIFDEKTEILIRVWTFLKIFLIPLKMPWNFWTF